MDTASPESVASRKSPAPHISTNLHISLDKPFFLNDGNRNRHVCFADRAIVGCRQQKGEKMDTLIRHSCEFLLTRWQTATSFDYYAASFVIITSGWITSRMTSR